ncbi:hypothetical protein [Saccharopolyspora sp. CA-218241]|uniref:hypothetical protein n=1 Tax=Saccharopolyspora sp. CA-218241 TaxID=3240027 RepID=UPI003D993051
MSKTTSDPNTPIFGELTAELGLPQLDIHDFDQHAFDLAEDEGAADDDGAESPRKGGRRRKPE